MPTQYAIRDHVNEIEESVRFFQLTEEGTSLVTADQSNTPSQQSIYGPRATAQQPRCLALLRIHPSESEARSSTRLRKYPTR